MTYVEIDHPNLVAYVVDNKYNVDYEGDDFPTPLLVDASKAEFEEFEHLLAVSDPDEVIEEYIATQQDKQGARYAYLGNYPLTKEVTR